jgi:hypothetical protein
LWRHRQTQRAEGCACRPPHAPRAAPCWAGPQRAARPSAAQARSCTGCPACCCVLLARVRQGVRSDRHGLSTCTACERAAGTEIRYSRKARAPAAARLAAGTCPELRSECAAAGGIEPPEACSAGARRAVVAQRRMPCRYLACCRLQAIVRRSLRSWQGAEGPSPMGAVAGRTAGAAAAA